MREKRDYQEKIFDKEFMYKKLGTNLDIVTDNANRTLQKIQDIMLDNYNFEYGRKDNLSIFHGVISDTNGRESSIRFFERGEIDENCNIGENAEVLIDCEDNKTNKYDFVKQSIEKLMQEFLSIEPSDKNTMRRKDILGMIEKLNDMGSKNKVSWNDLSNNTWDDLSSVTYDNIPNYSIKYYKNMFYGYGYESIISTNGNGIVYVVLKKTNTDCSNIDLDYIRRFQLPIGCNMKFLIIDENMKVIVNELS